MLIGLFSAAYANGQFYCMSNATVTTCSGTFLDDNGGNCSGDASPYSNNDFTFTICPDNPGDVVQVNFSAFQLQTSPNPNNSDRLYIYDGDSTGANELGSYAGNTLQGLAVTGTINNASGCLTFVFQCNTGNSSAMPGWEAQISCTTPCDPPISNSFILDPPPSGVEQSIGVCIGDAITFSGSGSAAGAGFSIAQYIWNLGDGTVDTTSGVQITHTYAEPGEYLVSLTIEDNNGCQSLNLEPLQVLVSTIPIFNSVLNPPVICLGDQAIIDGSPVESTTWTALPPQVVSGQTYLADGAGFSYSTSLTFDFFEPGAVLEDCDDLLSVFVNMEHSYIGDLFLQLTCPNGTNVTLLNWPNGGGGAFLGEAVDDGSVVPGVGFDYAWAPGQTNGNVDDNANWTMTNFTNQNGQNWNGNIADPGTYQADGNLCDMVGCPLNGSWTFTVVDNLAIDNGYIFSWGLNFNPLLFPDITTFTPIIGMSADSSYWTGPHIVNASVDANQITVEPPSPGDYDYTYTVFNNFGCEQDTTVTLSVWPPPILAVSDTILCENTLLLNAPLVGNYPELGCIWTVNLFDSFGDGWNGCNLTVLVDGVNQQTITMTTGSQSVATFNVPNGSQLQLQYNIGAFNNEVSYTVINPLGAQVYAAGPNPPPGIVYTAISNCPYTLFDMNFTWSPAAGLNNPNIQTPTATLNPGLNTYSVTVGYPTLPNCTTTETVNVTFFESPIAQDILICFSEGLYDLQDYITGAVSPDAVWTDSQGNVLPSTVFDSFDEMSGSYFYSFDAGDCVIIVELQVTILPPSEPSCCNLDYTFTTVDNDCPLQNIGEVNVTVNNTTFGPPYTMTFDNAQTGQTGTATSGSSTLFFDQLLTGTYDITLTDALGCLANFTAIISAPPLVTIEASLDTTVCIGGTATLSASAIGASNGPLTFFWTGGQTGSSIQLGPLTQETATSVYAVYSGTCVTNTDEVGVFLYDPLSSTIPNDAVLCPGESVLMQVLGTSGGLPPYTTQWQAFPGGVIEGNSFLASPEINASYCLTLTDACETPEITACVNVELFPYINPDFVAEPGSGCVPVFIGFEGLATNPEEIETSLWDFGDGSVSSDIQYTFHNYAQSGLFDVSLTIVSKDGCTFTRENLEFVHAYPVPSAAFLPSPAIVLIPEKVVNFVNNSFGGEMYQWTFGSYGSSVEYEPEVFFPIDEPTQFQVQLVVTNEFGCADTSVRTLFFQEQFVLFIPNSFTPDGDGLNEFWHIKGIDVDESAFRLEVYDRWGELVFGSEDINQPWDGSHLGGGYYVPDGVYSWRIVAKTKSTAEKKTLDGHVTLLR